MHTSLKLYHIRLLNIHILITYVKSWLSFSACVTWRGVKSDERLRLVAASEEFLDDAALGFRTERHSRSTFVTTSRNHLELHIFLSTFAHLSTGKSTSNSSWIENSSRSLLVSFFERQRFREKLFLQFYFTMVSIFSVVRSYCWSSID